MKRNVFMFYLNVLLGPLLVLYNSSSRGIVRNLRMDTPFSRRSFTKSMRSCSKACIMASSRAPVTEGSNEIVLHMDFSCGLWLSDTDRGFWYWRNMSVWIDEKKYPLQTWHIITHTYYIKWQLIHSLLFRNSGELRQLILTTNFIQFQSYNFITYSITKLQQV